MSPFLANWYVGWSLILAGLLSGAGLGLFFHREDLMGGYASFRRRLFRLGHVACVALGLLNVLGGVVFLPLVSGLSAELASASFIVGGLMMPVMCFLTGWRPWFRSGFVVPVLALAIGVAAILAGGVPCV